MHRLKSTFTHGFCVFCLLTQTLMAQSSNRALEQIETMAQSIPGLETGQQAALVSAFRQKMAAQSDIRQIPSDILTSMEHIVSAGFFEEAEPQRVADVALGAYHAERNGAPAEYVEDLSLIGFAHAITGDQLGAAAKSLQRLTESDIDPEVYQDLISYALAGDWSAKTIAAVTDGLMRGHKQNADVGKLALAMIIRIDQGLGSKTVQAMTEEEIRFILQRNQTNSFEKQRRDAIFQAMQDAIRQGVASDTAQELYYEAVEEKWSADVSQAVFKGMIEAHSIGLTPEKIALAMLIRVEQGLEGVSPEKMVQEEIAYVKNVEKKRLKIIQNDKTLDYSKPVPDPNTYRIHVEPKRRDPKRMEVKPDIYRQSQRTRINMALMQQSIQSFLGTPYKWGGASRRGTDCSGFTQSVYRDQGLIIPRNSRKQYQAGRIVTGQGLSYGDLVFFNKYGYGNVSHVGIYVGNGQFAHASCSKGVTVSRLDKRYYRVRYVGGRRMI